MQDRFVGDIGDFGKYGLLRALAGISPRAELMDESLSDRKVTTGQLVQSML